MNFSTAGKIHLNAKLAKSHFHRRATWNYIKQGFTHKNIV